MVYVELIKPNGKNNFLVVDGEIWMWDLPGELRKQEEIARQAYGCRNVLLAGYGLGLVQKFLTPKVTELLTIEKYPEVIEIVRRANNGVIYGNIEIGNFYDFPEDRRFDCVIRDIWLEIEPEYLDDYKRFKSKSERLLKGNGKILAWGQDYFEYLIEKENDR